jgi:signal transduction histidine kinase
MNILVVDDETHQLVGLRTGLESRNNKVLTVSSGEQALKLLINDHNKFELIITDYAMPGMDGMALLKKIRMGNKSLPVIMMTAYGEKDLIVDAMRNRCDGFIDKPFSLDQLVKEIERVMINTNQNTHSHQLPEFMLKFVHQLNNPLSAIFCHGELGMLESDNPEAVKQHLEGISNASEQIRKINREILDLGRVIEDNKEKVDINMILDDCSAMFEGLMTLNSVSLEKYLTEDHLYVLGNEFGLGQVFKNLISNAIESMDDSFEKRLKIRAEIEKASSTVLVFIEDTGCGISGESLKKIFTPYFTDKKDGTGLGLAIVADIVEQHMGEMVVYSKEGKGATFMVKLPMAPGKL